jgi:hypothetical protein
MKLGMLTVASIAGCTDSSQNGPEDVAEEFTIAVYEGDTETQRELIHDEADDYQIRDGPPLDYTIQEIREITPSEYGDEVGVSEDQINNLKQDMESSAKEVNASDYTLVYTAVTYDGGSNGETNALFLINNGSWLLYDIR